MQIFAIHTVEQKTFPSQAHERKQECVVTFLLFSSLLPKHRTHCSFVSGVPLIGICQWPSVSSLRLPVDTPWDAFEKHFSLMSIWGHGIQRYSCTTEERNTTHPRHLFFEYEMAIHVNPNAVGHNPNRVGFCGLRSWPDRNILHFATAGLLFPKTGKNPVPLSSLRLAPLKSKKPCIRAGRIVSPCVDKISK